MTPISPTDFCGSRSYPTPNQTRMTASLLGWRVIRSGVTITISMMPMGCALSLCTLFGLSTATTFPTTPNVVKFEVAKIVYELGSVDASTVLTMQHEEQIMSNVLDLDDSVAYENQEEEALFMTEEPPVGVEKLINHPATQGVETSSVMDYSQFK